MIKYFRFALYAPATARGTNLSLRKRTDELLNVINIAQQAMIARKPLNFNEEMPVFLAPEWYFMRPPDRGGLGCAYDRMDLNHYIPYMKEKCGAFGNWLIVPGSILWYMPGPVVYNTAFVFYQDKMFVYHKQIEGGDVNRAARQKMSAVFGFADTNENATDASRCGGKVSFKSKDIEGIFNAGPVKFGIEVCADHGEGILLKSTFGTKYGILSRDRQSKGLDLHIVVACGAGPIRQNLATKANGCFAFVDGSDRTLKGASNDRDRRKNAYCGTCPMDMGGDLTLNPLYRPDPSQHHTDLHEVPFKGIFKTLFISNRVELPRRMIGFGAHR